MSTSQMLKEAGKHKVARKIKKIEEQTAKIVRKEGVVPYEQRPAETRRKLSKFYRIDSWAFWNVLRGN